MDEDLGRIGDADRDGRASPEPASSLGHSATIPCAACLERGQTWKGSAPTCSFPNGGEFDSAGWNCATANMIRDLMPRFETPTSNLISGPHWMEDQYWGAITISDDVELPNGYALTLWVSWYKSRGRTEAMWLLDENEPPRLPTEGDIRAIAAHFAIAGGNRETGFRGEAMTARQSPKP